MWFSGDDVPYNEFLKAMLQGDVKVMNRYMNQVALETFSSFVSGRKPSEETNPERFYHGFVLGLMAEFTGRYRITSNRESGFGRYDVELIAEGYPAEKIRKYGFAFRGKEVLIGCTP